MAEERPRVSVVIPSYNYRHYLRESITSALCQPGVEVEVIVVDDASTDGSVEVAGRIAETDRRVRVIAHRDNRGHIATYNEGLAAATGEYLVLLSADDLLAYGALQRITTLMAAHPAVGLAYGRVCQFTGVPPSVTESRVRWKVWEGDAWLQMRVSRGHNCIVSPEVVLRRSVYERVGPYSALLPHTADFAMWLRAATVADVGYVGGPIQAFYRIHPENMHSTVFDTDKAAGLINDVRQRQMAFREALVDHPDGETLYRRACRTLAVEALRHACASYEAGRMETDPPSRYIEFALAVDADVNATRAWALLQRRMRANGPTMRILRTRSRIEDLRWTLRWRWWQRTGL